jgi:hypothetical protein
MDNRQHSDHGPYGTSELDQDGAHGPTGGKIGFSKHALDPEGDRSRAGAGIIARPHCSSIATARPIDTCRVGVR